MSFLIQLEVTNVGLISKIDYHENSRYYNQNILTCFDPVPYLVYDKLSNEEFKTFAFIAARPHSSG